MDVIGIGALNVDFIFQVDFRKIPFIKKNTERKITLQEAVAVKNLLEKGKIKPVKSGGGSAANTIYALSRMGFSCGFVGKVGEDREGEFILQELKSAGVDTTKIAREGKTGVCFIFLDKKGEKSALVLPGTNDNLLYKEVDLDYIKKAKILHSSSFIGETSFQTQKKLLLEADIAISFDPGEPHATRGWDALYPIIKKTWIFFSTNKEIELLTGKEFKEGCRKLLKEGVKIVVCKMGKEGSFVFWNKKEKFIPSLKVKAVDTTGAGDVYAAGFLAGVLKNLPPEQCGRLATEAAALSVTGFGRENYPQKKFLEEFLGRIKDVSEDRMVFHRER
ncbi:carbohydrate kinase family protein [Candidatus Aerophobetes bacterium]|nr:carbohydrate kinase family protein [Candidatus Aerophobetes bacterium]